MLALIGIHHPESAPGKENKPSIKPSKTEAVKVMDRGKGSRATAILQPKIKKTWGLLFLWPG
jgi:hypothetical protein